MSGERVADTLLPLHTPGGTRPGAIYGVSPPLAPSQGCEQETTSAKTRGDCTRPGAIDGVSPPLAPSQECEQGRRPSRRRGNGTRPGAIDEVMY